MGNFSELSGLKQWAALVLGAALITAALHFTLFKSQQTANEQAQTALDSKLRENAELESYAPKLKDMERQLANLKQQLEIERKIVPDEKEVDGFIKMLDAEAMKAGIEIRRFTAKPVSTREFYTEVPFEVELDGSYYSVLNFFDRVGKLERIVNMSALLVATIKKPSDAKVKHTYQYAPNESIVATCEATTFFSHDLTPPAGAPVKGKLVSAQQQNTAATNAALAASQGQNAQPQAAAAKPAAGKQPGTTQVQTAAPVSKATSKAIAPKVTPKKTTTVAVNQPKPAKPAVAVEDKKNPVDSKKDAH